MTLLQFLDVDHRVLDVNPVMNGKEKKMTKNKQVPIIQYDKNVKEYESDPKKIIRYNRVKLCDFLVIMLRMKESILLLVKNISGLIIFIRK